MTVDSGRRKDARARRGGKYEKVGGDGMGARREQDDIEVGTKWEPRRELRQAFTYFPSSLKLSFTKERARGGGGKGKQANMCPALILAGSTQPDSVLRA